MADLSTLGLFAAFLAGGISFVSPCVLPLAPGYVAFIAGNTTGAGRVDAGRAATVGLGLCFVLGFSTIFITLGASATALGQALLRYRYEMNLIGGAIVILFGLVMIGLARVSMMQRDLRFHLDIPGGKPVSAYVLGLAFGFGWTPCIGPILGAILTASAVTATLQEGVLLLAVYSAGLGIPFLLIAGFADRVTSRLRRLRNAGRRLQQIAGGVMIIMGAAMLTGQLGAFSYWLLETFPVLSRIG